MIPGRVGKVETGLFETCLVVAIAVAVAVAVAGLLPKVDTGSFRVGGECLGLVFADTMGLSPANNDMRSLLSGLNGDPGGDGLENATGDCFDTAKGEANDPEVFTVKGVEGRVEACGFERGLAVGGETMVGLCWCVALVEVLLVVVVEETVVVAIAGTGGVYLIFALKVGGGGTGCGGFGCSGGRCCGWCCCCGGGGGCFACCCCC
tara:strand:+ start:88 stop:705 length:618 start_codon:yes stop_codon:yes gene_type:complete